MSEALAIESRKGLEQVLKDAMRLAIRIALADGEVKVSAERNFLELVQKLESQRAGRGQASDQIPFRRAFFEQASPAVAEAMR